MQIRRLLVGENPPEGADFIEIARFPHGYMMTGTVSKRNSRMSAQGPFETYETAEKLGILWGAKEEAQLLYVVKLDV